MRFEFFCETKYNSGVAALAQSVEQCFRKASVVGSIPTGGFLLSVTRKEPVFPMRTSKNHPSHCLYCGTQLKWYASKYCSNQCQAQYEHEQYIAAWKAGAVTGLKADETISDHVRRYLIAQNGEKCSLCGWQEHNPTTGQIPITVDHIDGNWRNNREENLRLLCPNCHSLTPTYQNLNRGNGRRYRRRYESRKTDA